MESDGSMFKSFDPRPPYIVSGTFFEHTETKSVEEDSDLVAAFSFYFVHYFGFNAEFHKGSKLMYKFISSDHWRSILSRALLGLKGFGRALRDSPVNSHLINYFLRHELVEIRVDNIDAQI